MVRRPSPDRAGRSLLAALLLVLSCACRRASATWIADLDSTDSWRRRMAALALGQVDEPDVTSAFRALTLRLLETDPEVNAAIQDALRTLAQRHAELPAQALEKLPAERHRPRAVMAQLLVELERVGATSADATLTRYLAEELASNVPKRMEAARALQAERAARGSSPPP